MKKDDKEVKKSLKALLDNQKKLLDDITEMKIGQEADFNTFIFPFGYLIPLVRRLKKMKWVLK